MCNRKIEWKKDEWGNYSFKNSRWKVDIFYEEAEEEWSWVLKLQYGKGQMVISPEYFYTTSKNAKMAAKLFIDEWNIWYWEY